MNIQKLIEKYGANPVLVGKAVLEELGYKVELRGFGYNSMHVRVKDADGNVVFEELIGE